jgi:SAM-dependent methyltransferase
MYLDASTHHLHQPRALWSDRAVDGDAPNQLRWAELGGYDPMTYGESVGPDYDALYPPGGLDTDAAVELLAELAERHARPSLVEFGIGTGRLAIELHRRGLVVAGIDASERMVERLRAKAPSAPIDIAIGDFVSTRVAGSFAVVALVFNNILDPRGRAAQLALFENAARHLVPGGYFVVEAFVLGADAMDGNWSVSPRYVGADHVELQLVRYDIDTSVVERTLVHLLPDGPFFVSVRDSYATPGELDVMAHVHGMRRIARYSDWSRAPFTAHSRRHISVYELG